MLPAMDTPHIDPATYEELVYAGVLGKTIGVYMGRPFEGWGKHKLVEHWGLVDRYVADERKVPLVVSDDDITGTFTFVRGLEDSGRYAEATPEDFGHTWLNYIAELRTILWWGGLGVSTEHTAFIRLKDGIKPPLSGSCQLNGQVVAEQIGAQIFIDGFGLVCPGRPRQAADLARRAASVAHDGAAIHGAQVVAAMVAAAFTEKDVDRLLDIGVSVIPADCLIAQVHRDVRAWCHEDGDWHRTFERIAAQYGYDRYGGGCHMVPNHAIMVMAWAYAQGSFRRAQAIINTAGWDTDCNAANVGTVMALVVGLAGINREYDFQAPFADRLIMPTAEGTRCATDCLAEALYIARMGRRIMGWPALPAPKGGAAFHFCLPQSRQGFLPERSAAGMPGTADAVNVAAGGGRALAIDWREASDRHPVRVSTPLLYEPTGGGYGIMGCSRVSSGQTVTLHGTVAAGGGRLRLFLRHFEPGTRKPTGMVYSQPVQAVPGAAVALTVTAPDVQGWPMADLGVEIDGAAVAAGRLLVDRIEIGGAPRLVLPAELPKAEHGLVGWVTDAENWWGAGIRKDRGRAVAVTGTSDWRDYAVAGTVAMHCGELGGLVARYQGLGRYLLLAKTRTALRLVSRWDGVETVLGERACTWAVDEKHRLELAVRGDEVVARCDGAELFRVRQDRLASGGAGYAVEAGLLRFEQTAIG